MISKEKILTLFCTSGVGKTTVRRLIENWDVLSRYKSDLLKLLSESKRLFPRIKIPNQSDIDKAGRDALKILENAKKFNISVITYFDKDYPQRLKNIQDYPIILYAKGNLSCLNDKLAVAVVGTREPTNYGKKSAEKIAYKIAKTGGVVVSGLALGCDTAAHKGCLDAHGKTVAILGHGLDFIFPKENTKLADQIIDENGCLISEYPLGEQVKPHYFVERDRLQSGMSMAVIVVETGIVGGTMHTVKFCRIQERQLACIAHPESLRNEKSVQGNIKLIKEGARAIESASDVDKLLYDLSNIDSSPNLRSSVSKNEIQDTFDFN